MKTKILVPTDFSSFARNALDYALGLSADFNGEIILMHSILYNDSAFIGDKSIEEENEKRYREAEELLSQEVEYSKKKNQAIPVKPILKSGPADISVSSVIDSEKIDYVVMGTEGASGLQATIFGSFTSNVLNFSPCPVFTIPKTGTYRSLKNIVCTTEMEESETNALKHTLMIAEKSGAAITFYNANANEEAQRIDFYKFQKKIEGLTSSKLIDYVTVESNDILEAIERYVCEAQPDLIVTLGKERNFFDKLFGKKVTKQLCLHSTIPLLSFPNNFK